MKQICPICHSDSFWLDVMDLNKSCGANPNDYIPLAGIPVYYALCTGCGFCFAPELHAWSAQEFATKIYNDDYIKVDPEYVLVRPQSNAEFLIKLLGDKHREIRHLDYGGGEGRLSHLLTASGWSSTSYDPFANKDVALESLGKFNFITAFEVFEHVADVNQLMINLTTLLEEEGIVIFSTLLSDGQIKSQERITWWYAAPRNGHISLFSQQSLQRLANQHSLTFNSFSSGLHVLWKKIPSWTSHFIQAV
jgi:SAM-dependent methyltransferase